MFSTELFTILACTLAACGVCASVWTAIRQIRSEKYCKSCTEFVELSNKRSLSLRRIAEVEATLTELLDSYEALRVSHRKLRSRLTMREHRQEGKKSQDEVDLTSPPVDEVARASYKKALRDKAKASKLL